MRWKPFYFQQITTILYIYYGLNTNVTDTRRFCDNVLYATLYDKLVVYLYRVSKLVVTQFVLTVKVQNKYRYVSVLWLLCCCIVVCLMKVDYKEFLYRYRECENSRLGRKRIKKPTEIYSAFSLLWKPDVLESSANTAICPFFSQEHVTSFNKNILFSFCF